MRGLCTRCCLICLSHVPAKVTIGLGAFEPHLGKRHKVGQVDDTVRIEIQRQVTPGAALVIQNGDLYVRDGDSVVAAVETLDGMRDNGCMVAFEYIVIGRGDEDCPAL